MIRAQRLSGRRRFDAVRSSGVDARGQVVRIRVLRKEGPSQAGIAVRGSKSAVLRNRARRRIRAVLCAELGSHPGVDVVVSAGAREAATAPFSVLRDDIRATLGAVSLPETPSP